MGEKPQRSHVFMCEIGADSQEDLVAELINFANRIERGELSAGVSGGYSSGSIYAYRHDPAMTHDEYFRQLNEHLDRMTAPTPDREQQT